MARKVLPPFSLEKKEGERKYIEMCNISSARKDITSELVMTRYSDFIPIRYLTHGNIDYSSINAEYSISSPIQSYLYIKKKKIDYKKARVVSSKLLLKKGPLLDMYINLLYGTFDKGNMEKEVNDFINFDGCVSVDAPGWGSRSFERAAISFRSGNWVNAFRTASARGSVLHGLATVMRDGEQQPLIVIAIPKEDYFYQKLYYLLNRRVDLSKCVVFVDRELDSTSFPEKGVRNTLYKKHIVPYLDSLSVDVWKVPSSYMKEKCFLGDYKLEGKTLVEKKKEIDEIKEKFCKQFREKYNPKKENVELEDPNILSVWNDAMSSITYTGGVDPVGTAVTAGGATVTTGTGVWQQLQQAPVITYNTTEMATTLQTLLDSQEEEVEDMIEDEEDCFDEDTEI